MPDTVINAIDPDTPWSGRLPTLRAVGCRRLLAIDPGRAGAIAAYDGETLLVVDLPDTIPGIDDAIRELLPVWVCFLEKPFHRHIEGPTRIAASAAQFGALKAALYYLGVPIREVAPNKWKPAMGLSGDKGASRRRAGEAFPDDAAQFKRVKDDGRAEAALLALYAWERRT